MRIDRQVAALARNKALDQQQRQLMQDVREQWRNTARTREILDQLDEYGTGAEITDCPSLLCLTQDHLTAVEFVSRWVEGFLVPLKQSPLCEVPFHQSYSGGFASMRLAGSGRANLALLCYEQLPNAPAPRTASFVDQEQAEIVIAGNAHGLHHRLSFDAAGAPEITSQSCHWKAGNRIELAPRIQSRDVLQVQGSLVILHLNRACDNPAPSRSHSLLDGALTQQSSGSKLSSQVELAIAVLGAMDRGDAAGPIAELTSQGPTHLRWEALRHSLALDAQLGFESLSRIADTAGDELALPAQRLRGQLVQSYPDLAKEAELCPA